MTTVFRFEDTYGAYSVMNAISVLHSGVSLDSIGRVQRGLGINDVFIVTPKYGAQLRNAGVERLINVFDMDNDEDKGNVIGQIRLQCMVTAQKSILRDAGYEGSIEYVPTVFAAETALLVQYIDKLSGYLPDMVVGKFDINTTLRYFVMLCAELKRNNDAKKFELFLEPRTLLNNYRNKYGTGVFNRRLFEMSMDLNITGYNEVSLYQQRKYAEDFVKGLKSVDMQYVFGSQVITLQETAEELNQKRVAYLKEIGIL